MRNGGVGLSTLLLRQRPDRGRLVSWVACHASWVGILSCCYCLNIFMLTYLQCFKSFRRSCVGRSTISSSWREVDAAASAVPAPTHDGRQAPLAKGAPLFTLKVKHLLWQLHNKFLCAGWYAFYSLWVWLGGVGWMVMGPTYRDRVIHFLFDRHLTRHFGLAFHQFKLWTCRVYIGI